MSIDTPQKRSSVFELPGLMLNPYPSGAVTASDRVQISDFYAGIKVAPPVSSNQTCWSAEIEVSQVWASEQETNSTWIQEKELNGSWVKEDEVVPCQD